MRYWTYLCYVLRHKWLVFVEACQLGIPWLGTTHDLSKFSPAEFGRAARRFCGTKDEQEAAKDSYRYAWLHHQHANKHHWVYWVLYAPIPGQPYDEKWGCLPMPESYLLEMVADWRGSGKTFGTPDTAAWYRNNRSKILLHPETRMQVELLLELS